MPFEDILAIPFLLAFACEYVDSSLGMGYGTLLTPILLVYGYSAREVVPCVLLSELCTGVGAAVLHHRAGNVDFFGDAEVRSASKTLCLLSAAGAVFGASFALRLSQPWLNAAISCVVIGAGLFVLLAIRKPQRYRRTQLLGLASMAAFNKGLSGGGYGPLVTGGQLACGLPAKKAVAITSLSESVTCLVGVCAHLSWQRQVNWELAAVLIAGASLAVPVATRTVRILPERKLRLAVGGLTTVLGIGALCRMVTI